MFPFLVMVSTCRSIFKFQLFRAVVEYAGGKNTHARTYFDLFLD